MELRQIRTFVTAARLLNFRHAASELGITQPAVSQQIRAMEVELGFDIFQRQARGVVLTPAGEQMFAALRQVNDSAEAMYAAARMTRRGEMGVIRLGYSTSLMSEPALPRRLRAFYEANPAVTVELCPMLVQTALEQLMAQDLDIAVMRCPLPPLPADLRSTSFSSADLVIALPEDHPLAASERVDGTVLARETILVMDDPPGIGLRHVVESLFAAVTTAPIRYQPIGDMATIVGLVGAGMGVSLLPEGIARSANGIAIRRIAKASARSEAAVISRVRSQPVHVRRLLRALTE